MGVFGIADLIWRSVEKVSELEMIWNGTWRWKRGGIEIAMESWYFRQQFTLFLGYFSVHYIHDGH